MEVRFHGFSPCLERGGHNKAAVLRVIQVRLPGAGDCEFFAKKADPAPWFGVYAGKRAGKFPLDGRIKPCRYFG